MQAEISAKFKADDEKIFFFRYTRYDFPKAFQTVRFFAKSEE